MMGFVCARVLLLDVMETLVTEPFFETVPSFFGLTLEELIREKDPVSWVEFEKGNIDEATYIRTFFSDRRRVDQEALRAWMTKSYRFLDGVEDLLSELRSKSVPMYALSNYSMWYELIEAKLGLSRFLDWSFVSCRTGRRKPDPEAYLHAARTLRVETSSCIFVDDRRTNVAAAEAVGMRGVLRTPGIEAFRSALAAQGLL